MSESLTHWNDLKPRLVSGAILLFVGVICVVTGGALLDLLIALICGAMMWELSGMLAPSLKREALLVAGISTISVILALVFPHVATRLLLVCVPIAASFMLAQKTPIFVLCAYALIFGCVELDALRDENGLPSFLWFALVIIMSDISGYFAGRLLGGPKFWPRVSPKKTWSGTISGWICAAVLGLFFSVVYDVSVLGLMLLSVALSFSGQMGDAAESALKRFTNIKDSSSLIPGHGGFMDRFDAIIGAGIFLLLTSNVFNLSGVLP